MSLTIEQLAGQVAALEARLVSLETGATAAATPDVASDYEMSGDYGDPVIKYGLKPKYWAEQPDPFVGRRFSETSPEYMDATARYYDACAFMARKEGGDENVRKAEYKSKDARRARGHAKRLREVSVSAERYGTSGSGASAKHAVTPEAEYSDLGDEIPF